MSKEKNEIKSRDFYIYQNLFNLALSRFTWDGLPEGLTSERLEEMLISSGELMCFKNIDGIFILPCYGEQKQNVYGIHQKYMIQSYNGTLFDIINYEDGVLIKNNPLSTPDTETLLYYAEVIDDIEKTQGVNLFQQNMPKVILSDNDTKMTGSTIIEQLKKFKFIIFGKKSLAQNITSSDVLDTSAPYVLDKLQEYRNDKFNEILSFLGINNIPDSKKKERMITSEVQANDDYVKTCLDLMFDMRKKACEEINEKFSLNMSVEKRRIEDGEIYSNIRGISGEKC